MFYKILYLFDTVDKKNFSGFKKLNGSQISGIIPMIQRKSIGTQGKI